MAFEFKPIDYKDLKIGDAVEFEYVSFFRRKREFEGYVHNISPSCLTVSFLKIYISIPDPSLSFKVEKDFKRSRISNLRRLEVVALEDSKRSSDIPS